MLFQILILLYGDAMRGRSVQKKFTIERFSRYYYFALYPNPTTYEKWRMNLHGQWSEAHSASQLLRWSEMLHKKAYFIVTHKRYRSENTTFRISSKTSDRNRRMMHHGPVNQCTLTALLFTTKESMVSLCILFLHFGLLAKYIREETLCNHVLHIIHTTQRWTSSSGLAFAGSDKGLCPESLCNRV